MPDRKNWLFRRNRRNITGCITLHRTAVFEFASEGFPMFRRLQVATLIALVFSAAGITDSAEAHFGRGGGIRIGGGLLPRGRQGGNSNGNRPAGNSAPAPAPKPAPNPLVAKNGTNSNPAGKLPATNASTTTNKPTGTVVSNNLPSKSNSLPGKGLSEAAPKTAEPQKPADANRHDSRHLVFNLSGNEAPAEPTAVRPADLTSEAKQALQDALTSDAPAAVSSADVAVKQAALPQIPVGATVTLNGKDLSSKEGQVVLQIGEIALPATITEWKDDKVTCTLPVLGLTRTSKATLHVLKADGKTASTLDCELVTPLTR